MLKDLKEKVKNISEIVGMISVIGTLMVAVTAALYNFGFFSFFSISIWKLPINISEIITDVVVILPKLLLIIVVCSIVFFILNIILFLITEGCGFIINIIYTHNKQNDTVKAKSIITKYIRKYGLPIFTIVSFMYFLGILVFVIYKNKPIDYNPCVMFSIWFVTFICFNLIGRLRITIFWIMFSLLMYFITMISSGIYDASIESDKAFSDSIMKIDDHIVNNIKILKVYDTGIIVMSLPNKLDFFYSSDIKGYSMRTKNNDIFRDDIILNTDNNKNELFYKWVKLSYSFVKVLINYNLKKISDYMFNCSTYYSYNTLIQKMTNNIVVFLSNKV